MLDRVNSKNLKDCARRVQAELIPMEIDLSTTTKTSIGASVRGYDEGSSPHHVAVGARN